MYFDRDLTLLLSKSILDQESVVIIKNKKIDMFLNKKNKQTTTSNYI